MHKFILSIFVTVTLFTTQLELVAQNLAISIVNDTAIVYDNSDFGKTVAWITNLSPNDIELDVIRTKNLNNENWINGMCVNGICQYVSTDSVRINLSPNSKMEFNSRFLLLDPTTNELFTTHFKFINTENREEYLELDTYALNGHLLTTSTEDLDQQEISLFPNPVQDYITIKCEKKIKNIDIINEVGSIIQTIQGNQKQISLAHLNRGMYFAKITTNEGIFQNRFLKL